MIINLFQNIQMISNKNDIFHNNHCFSHTSIQLITTLNLTEMLLQITQYIDHVKSLYAKNHIVCCLLQGWFNLAFLPLQSPPLHSSIFKQQHIRLVQFAQHSLPKQMVNRTQPSPSMARLYILHDYKNLVLNTSHLQCVDQFSSDKFRNEIQFAVSGYSYATEVVVQYSYLTEHMFLAKVVPLNSPHTLFPYDIVIMLMAALIL